MRRSALFLLALLPLAGCGKIQDTLATGASGYSLRCIEGTKYVLLTSDKGLAITPHVGPDGRPRECK